MDEYISQFPTEVQELLRQICEKIREVAPAASEKMSYGMPTFYLHGNLVHVAAYKNHIGFYPAPSAIKAFQSEISGFKNSKGAVQFPLGQPLPFDLIARMTAFRVEENIAKHQARLSPPTKS